MGDYTIGGLVFDIVGYSGSLPSNLEVPNFIDGRRVRWLALSDLEGTVTTMKISPGIENIRELGTFQNLEEVSIPYSVLSITPDAFSQAPNLTTITINQSPKSSLASSTLWGAPGNPEVFWIGTEDNNPPVKHPLLR